MPSVCLHILQIFNCEHFANPAACDSYVQQKLEFCEHKLSCMFKMDTQPSTSWVVCCFHSASSQGIRQTRLRGEKKHAAAKDPPCPGVFFFFFSSLCFFEIKNCGKKCKKYIGLWFIGTSMTNRLKFCNKAALVTKSNKILSMSYKFP